MKFTKMQGIGNDYVYIDCFEETAGDPHALAVKLSDRHFGIGGDGIILILPSQIADCRMDMYNADGSRGKMCGNGVRCVARYMFDRGRVKGPEVTVETQSGIKTLTLHLENGAVKDVTVDMGAPILEPGKIPVRWPDCRKDPASPIVSLPIEADGATWSVTCVSMGNPHAVLFVEDTDAAPVERVGKILENHPAFPDRVNVEFVQIVDDSTVKMRVWERGSGETMACGTGACAAAVACILNGKTKREVLVRLLGGDLRISWKEDDGPVFMTGQAKPVFTGEVDPDAL